MHTTRTSRPAPRTLTALAGALAAVALVGAGSARAHGGDHAAAATAPAGMPAAVTAEELALRSDMRRLWEDHVTWTRLAIISLTTASPDTKATVARLLRNQADIGNAVKPFYGAAAGNELTRQLRRHILIAADVVGAAKAADPAKLAAAQARWQRNGDDIAGVLASANPRHWPLATLRAELRKHLQLTTEEAVARLQRNWQADVAAYDRIHAHALHMADLLSAGLVAQFPKRFR
jgi:hypothetical protein